MNNGEPKKDRKRHLPRVTVLTSTVEAMQEIANEQPGVPLSSFYQMALNDYIERHRSQRRIVKL